MLLLSSQFSLSVQLHCEDHMQLPCSVVAAGQVELVVPIPYLVFCSILI